VTEEASNKTKSPEFRTELLLILPSEKKKALIILPSEKNSHQIERNRGLNFKPRLLDLF
jgi:hypothetical protein